MSTSLQETGDCDVSSDCVVDDYPANGATQDGDNHVGCEPLNLSPYAFSGLSTRKENQKT